MNVRMGVAAASAPAGWPGRGGVQAGSATVSSYRHRAGPVPSDNACLWTEQGGYA